MHRESDMASNRPANFSTATLQHVLSRRSALRQLGLAGLALSAAPAFAEDIIKLPLPSDPRDRPSSTPHAIGATAGRTGPPSNSSAPVGPRGGSAGRVLAARMH